MKYLSSLVVLALVSLFSQAQSFQVLLDPINPYQTHSLFQLTLVNPGNFSGSVQLKAQLKTRRGKLLMTQVTTQEIAPQSSQSVRGAAVTANTAFVDADFGQLYQEGRPLPPLNYVLCVEAFAIGDLNTKTQECTDYQASDFINITAVYPPTEEVIYDPRPQFNWINLDAQTSYQYNFRMVALEEKQNPNVALRRNNPMVVKDGLQQNQLLFPADAIPLKSNQRYAWQLDIQYQGETVAKTDAFTFTYKDEEQYIDIPRNLSYVDITEIENGANLYAVGEFKFKYPSDVKTSLKAEVYRLPSEKQASAKSASKKQLELTNNQFQVELGVNKYELDLKDQVYLKHLKKYQLLLKDEAARKTYQVNITYVNPDYIKNK